MSRLLRRAVRIALAAGVLTTLAALAGGAGGSHDPQPWRLVDTGGGYGGESGSQIWAEAWWLGAPTGPGPYTGSPSGGVSLCSWHDLGPAVADLNNGLSEASLPLSFWSRVQSGGHPGIWGIDEWAQGLLASAHGPDHFDLVACPRASEVPSGGTDIETSLPRARPPGSRPLYVWIFWDTVPDPPAGGLPPVIEQAFRKTGLGIPSIGTSPDTIGGVTNATVVNFPTWLWIDSAIWREHSATAEAGGYVATVWAWPTAVHWSAHWDFADKSSNPEGGVSFEPESLDQSCQGPGTVYDLANAATTQSTDCSFTFTQSTFGTTQTLSASVVWDVTWAYSSPSGVVGGEGTLGPVETTGTRPITVLQIESVITRG
jgi:hypothetical protein